MTQKTGRVLVRFAPGRGKRTKSLLHQYMGLREGAVAFDRDFQSQPSEAHHAPALFLDDIGVGAVSPEAIGVLDPPATLDNTDVLSVRPEVLIRRPSATFHPLAESIAPRAPGPGWLADMRQSWALNAIGIDPTVAEGDGVVVGLIDSGVDAAHPDLAQAITGGVSLLPGQEWFQDGVGHGTHCAGLIAGAMVPATGRPRYAVAPLARIFVVRVFDAHEAAREADVIHAVQLAARHGCRVLSLSAGHESGGVIDALDAQLGERLDSQGGLLFAAAGNDSARTESVQPTEAPGNAPKIASVGALTLTGGLLRQSNGRDGDQGGNVDLVAPGAEVESAYPGRGVLPASGTSVATPIAAAIAAIYAGRDPSLRGQALFARVRAAAVALPRLPAGGAGAGLVKVV